MLIFLTIHNCRAWHSKLRRRLTELGPQLSKFCCRLLPDGTHFRAKFSLLTMRFFKRQETSQVSDASALQIALLEEAERGIYGDSALFAKNNESPRKPSIYTNIFEQEEASNSSHHIDSFTSRPHYPLKNHATGQSLFPLFDYCLYTFPMWITTQRRYPCINIIGIIITFTWAIFYALDALTGAQFTGLDADNLEAIGSAYKIIVAGNAIWIPTQLLSQTIFHAKYMHIFWTDDKRDNRMIYFIAEQKLYKKIYIAMFIYLIIKLSLVSVYTFAAYRYTRDYVYSDFIIGGDIGFIGWQIVKFLFFYIPRSLHGIVIFLYCLEWKFRIRYFWKCKFIEYLHENSLLKHYKKMIKMMDYQLFWIKVWMGADALAISIAIWYWLWVWFQFSDTDTDTPLIDLIIEGLGYIIYHGMGFVLTWFTASSITTEADDLFKCAFQILEKLNEQHFTQCFKSDGFNENKEKLVDYHQINFLEEHDDITGYAESTSSMKKRKSGKRNKYSVSEDYEESWKVLMNNKDIVWEEWIFINNCDLNSMKDEMKRACLIKQLETFILYYNKHPCVFSIGIVLRYTTMLKIVLFFMAAKVFDYLWGSVV